MVDPYPWICLCSDFGWLPSHRHDARPFAEQFPDLLRGLCVLLVIPFRRAFYGARSRQLQLPLRLCDVVSDRPWANGVTRWGWLCDEEVVKKI